MVKLILQTLPIGYYPTLSDESLDKILMDKSQYTVEWMVTSGEYAKSLDIPALLSGNHHVSALSQHLLIRFD